MSDDDPFHLNEMADKALRDGWPIEHAQNLLAAAEQIAQLANIRRLLAEEERLSNHLALALDIVGQGNGYWPRECRLDGTADMLDRAMQHFYELRPHRKNPYDMRERPVVERPHAESRFGYLD